MIMTKEEAFKIELPKWPQCVIDGEKITEEQALEIIRRTDMFFFGYDGNNHEFNRKAREICKIGDYCDKKTARKWGLVYTLYIANNWISCAWIGGYHGWCHPDGRIFYRNNIGKYPEVAEVYKDLSKLGKKFPFLNLTCTLMNGEENCATESLVSMRLKDGKVEFIDTIPIDELDNLMTYSEENGFGRKGENYFGLEQIQKWADQVYGKGN